MRRGRSLSSLGGISSGICAASPCRSRIWNLGGAGQIRRAAASENPSPRSRSPGYLSVVFRLNPEPYMSRNYLIICPLSEVGGVVYGRCFAPHNHPMVHLVVVYEDRGFQWPLKDHYPVRVYTPDHHLLVQFTGEFIRHLVEHHLSLAVLQDEVRRVFPRQRVPPLLNGRPKFLVDPKERAVLRARRRQRGKTT